MRVFLSGGTRGDWQDKVKAAFPDGEHSFFDPRTLRHLELREIAATERSWLDQCDVLFFYLEASNPSGLGSAFEVGFCTAKGIPVVFIDEKQTTHTQWLGFHCTLLAATLAAGIDALRDFESARS